MIATIDAGVAHDAAGNPTRPQRARTTPSRTSTSAPSASFTATQGGANVLTGSALATTPVTFGVVAPRQIHLRRDLSLQLTPVTPRRVWARIPSPWQCLVLVCFLRVLLRITEGSIPAPQQSVATYPGPGYVPAVTVNGVHTITVTVTDLAGNVRTLTNWIYVNVNQISTNGKTWVIFDAL